jgi:branched-subunit amino acid aminotransferase/4-amino-4-deoxychorismate lyase
MTGAVLEIDGRRVSAEVAWSTASAFGHFTAMQVRGGRTRGLALHLARLEAANRELFGVGLNGDHVRSLIRHALDRTEDASVRVYCFETDAEPALMVTVREPAELASPQRLRSVRYLRPDAHLKHLATGQGYYSWQARRHGFDDALLVAETGTIAETATGNIGLFDGSGVVWPDAPMLPGITLQLLERILPEQGVSVQRASVMLEDVPRFDGAFLSSARGVGAVNAIDGVDLPEQEERIAAVVEAYASVPWDPI